MPDASPTIRHLRGLLDAQLRGVVRANHLATSIDGPLVRVEYPSGVFVGYRSLQGIGTDELDALIGRQRDHFSAKGRQVEWKTYGHDLPEDLPDRLRAAGFVPHAPETVMVAESRSVAHALADRPLPAGAVLRDVVTREDFARIAAMESAIWGDDRMWLADELTEQVTADPDLIDVYVVEAGGQIVAAAWAVREPGTDFMSLWGGSTLAAWRRNGLYSALVAVRATRAVTCGARYLQVDASDDSRPILERLGFVAVTTTTPYVFVPAGAITPPGSHAT